jgi:hypothetical protein
MELSLQGAKGRTSHVAPSGVAQTAEVRRLKGTFYLSAQKLIFYNSDLDKWTTVCKAGDLKVFLKPFWIWKHMDVHEVHVHEVHVYEVHAYEVHAREAHAYEMYAHEVHVYEAHTHEVHAMRCTL